MNSTGWFRALRRDRMLFAILGVTVLVLNMFQPLAAAAMGSNDRFVICTSAGAAGGSNDGSVPVGHECPLCIAGHCCTAPAPVFRAVAAEPVADLAPAVISARIDFDRFVIVRPSAIWRASSAIRAPPSPA